jgi:hypothetical protein
MRPATHSLAINEPSDLDIVITRVQARLDQDPAPAVLIERTDSGVRFSSQTWGPILAERIDRALEDVLGPEGVRRAFARDTDH